MKRTISTRLFSTSTASDRQTAQAITGPGRSPFLLFFNKIILTFTSFRDRIAPKGAICHEPLPRFPIRRLRFRPLCGHRPLCSPAVFCPSAAGECSPLPAGTADDGPLCPGGLDRSRPPPVGPAHREGGSEGGPPSRPGCLGVGLWRVAALLHSPFQRPGFSDADQYLLFSVPLLHPHAVFSGSGHRHHCLGHLRSCLVSIHISGGAAAAAAVLFGVAAAPPC